MKVLYLDCASGVSGDMLLGAMLDLGIDLAKLKQRLSLLPLKGYRIASREVERSHFGARKVDVRVSGPHGHRGLKEIREIVGKSALEDPVRQDAMKIFRRIVEVEARIHRIPVERVHLHEVGAVDAIVDVVGSVICLHELLDFAAGDRLVCSPLNVGSGTVKMEHGILPVPAPATAALLEGIPIYSAGPRAELVTPTGAAIVSTIASSFGAPPPMIIDRIGYGAGDKEFPGHPNVLRATIGAGWPEEDRSVGSVMVVECNIDDMNPQGYGYLMERLFEAGAKEVFYTPVQMKKARPGVMVTAICLPGILQDVAKILFEETTTIGLRYRPAGRVELAREIVPVMTRFGKIRVKVSSLEGRVMQAQPEYEDCRRIAARRKAPLKEVQAAAMAAWWKRTEATT